MYCSPYIPRRWKRMKILQRKSLIHFCQPIESIKSTSKEIRKQQTGSCLFNHAKANVCGKTREKRRRRSNRLWRLKFFDQSLAPGRLAPCVFGLTWRQASWYSNQGSIVHLNVTSGEKDSKEPRCEWANDINNTLALCYNDDNLKLHHYLKFPSRWNSSPSKLS